MANNIQNRAYLPHYITDPHCHPLLLLQKLLNLSIDYTQFTELLKNKNINQKTFKYNILIVNNLPYESITNTLINLINQFNFPVILKTSDYHTFVVNQEFIQELKRTLKPTEKLKLPSKIDYVWKEKNFELVDKLIIHYLLRDIKNNYKLLSEKFLSQGINKVIDAFTTSNFYEFYKSINSILTNEFTGFKIKFLVDNNFFLDNPDIIFDKQVLGLKFFIDGTILSNTVWNWGTINCFFDPKSFNEIINLLSNKIYNLSKVYLAFHCIGIMAFKYLVKDILKKIFLTDGKFENEFFKKIFIRIEHCTFMSKDDFSYLIDFINSYKLYKKFFLVLNPENTTLKLVDIYRYRDYLYPCYSSDCPVFDLDLKNSIYNFVGVKDNFYTDKIVSDIFSFNSILFE